ncbi:MAG: hypothetical protein GY847_01240 [Proteobacteria bacterium]|nr:hypothetical protein [Pseudomonadota bacterium]
MFEKVTNEIEERIEEWTTRLVDFPNETISERRNSQNRTLGGTLKKRPTAA